MPSTLHCVLLLGKYRLLLALADGHFVQTALSRQRLLTGGTRLENGPLLIYLQCFDQRLLPIDAEL
jgi:hypothetical protein